MPPFDGRRIWFVGIGGAGLSGYALLARAWGAEVGGWDRVDTPYLTALGGALIELAPDPVVPEGWNEVVVSTAYRDQVGGRPRAEFLAELVSFQLDEGAVDRFPFEDDNAKPPLPRWGWRVKQVTIAQATI